MVTIKRQFGRLVAVALLAMLLAGLGAPDTQAVGHTSNGSNTHKTSQRPTER